VGDDPRQPLCPVRTCAIRRYGPEVPFWEITLGRFRQPHRTLADLWGLTALHPTPFVLKYTFCSEGATMPTYLNQDLGFD
jgi:hypothetical protein